MPGNDSPSVSIVNGEPAVQPDPLIFDRPGAVVITWKLDRQAVAAGFRFAETERGIRIDHEVVNGRPEQTEHVRGQFERAQSADTEYRLVFKNNRSGRHEYKYTIRLKTPGGGEVSKDPSIINNW